VGGEGEAKVGLGKGGDGTPEGGSDVGGDERINLNGHERAFVVVDVKASGLGKVIKKLFEVASMLRNGTNDNESVICILENGARSIINERVEEEPSTRCL
jgi:hypothetical protein